MKSGKHASRVSRRWLQAFWLASAALVVLGVVTVWILAKYVNSSLNYAYLYKEYGHLERTNEVIKADVQLLQRIVPVVSRRFTAQELDGALAPVGTVREVTDRSLCIGSQTLVVSDDRIVSVEYAK